MVFGAKRLPQIIRRGFALFAPCIDIKRGKPLIGDAGAATIRQAGTAYAAQYVIVALVIQAAGVATTRLVNPPGAALVIILGAANG